MVCNISAWSIFQQAGKKVCLIDPEEFRNVWHSEYDGFREAGKIFGK